MPKLESSSKAHTGSRITLGRLALVLASVTVGLLIGEAMVRLVAPQPVVVPFADDISGISCGLPHAHGRHAVPGAFEVSISFDSDHFRGAREFTPEPAPGVLRIAALGDSVTFGWGASDNDTYPAQLERILGASLGPRQVEVMNTGFPGRGTGEEALYYDIWVKRFHPSLVILNVFVNDPSDEVARRLFVLDGRGDVSPRTMKDIAAKTHGSRWFRHALYRFPGLSFLLQHSQLLNLVRLLASAGIEDLEAPRGMAREKFSKVGLPLVAGEVRWLQKRVQESGARLVVVFLPSPEAFYPFPASWSRWVEERQWEYGRLVETLRGVCARNTIPFLDLTSRVRERAEEIRQPLYYLVVGHETHPNPKGYRVFAETVANFLVEEGIVDTKLKEEAASRQ